MKTARKKPKRISHCLECYLEYQISGKVLHPKKKEENLMLAEMMEACDGKSGDSITHHYPCECRERYFEGLAHRLEAARAALFKYGRHQYFCAMMNIAAEVVCTCGFDKDMEALQKEER